jgi:ribose 5-phosphate isomerase B
MARKVFIAADHGGFYLKERIKGHLSTQGYSVVDKGALEFNQEDDYPDYVIPLAEEIAKDNDSFGIILGRSGNGEQIAANKVKGARATLCLTTRMAKMAREDNNANILAMGADFVLEEEAIAVVEAFISTPFSDKDRHKRRIEKITKYESTHN